MFTPGVDLSIDTAFPGGNIIVDSIVDDTVEVHQDIRDTQGDWFYWCFRIQGAEGRKLKFRFTQSPAIGVRGPAISSDQGATWVWLRRDHSDGNAFSYHFPDDAKDVQFSFGMPYQEHHLAYFLRCHSPSQNLRTETLCRTNKGRAVECLYVGRLGSEPSARVLLTCRHHCCEMMASYTLEGLMGAVLSSNNNDMKWLRDHVEIMVIPFVDKDGVEEGDQGKNRHPHDHNQDYGDESLYASVRAIRDKVPQWYEGRLQLALDFHCPRIQGRHNEDIYLVGSPVDSIWHEELRFSEVLEKVRSTVLPFFAANNLPYGHGWNTPEKFNMGKSFAAWAAELSGVKMASTLEIPYANAGGVEVNQCTARAFGHTVACAISRYLRNIDQ